jgi:hypothetical protein
MNGSSSSSSSGDSSGDSSSDSRIRIRSSSTNSIQCSARGGGVPGPMHLACLQTVAAVVLRVYVVMSTSTTRVNAGQSIQLRQNTPHPPTPPPTCVAAPPAPCNTTPPSPPLPTAPQCAHPLCPSPPLPVWPPLLRQPADQERCCGGVGAQGPPGLGTLRLDHHQQVGGAWSRKRGARGGGGGRQRGVGG